MPKLPPPRNLREGIKETPLDFTIEPKTGWFGYMGRGDNGEWLPVVQWTHCRDTFQEVSGYAIKTKGMWFCHKIWATENICAFIDQIEEKLYLTKRSVFRKTDYPEITWVKPSPFWVNDFVRRSFFTLCLRCGMQYKRMKDNFDYSMYRHYQVSRDTAPAIKRFLKGYTFYPYEDPEYNVMGWQFLFSNDKGEPVEGYELEELLVWD